MEIKLLDLQAQYKKIQSQIRFRMDKVLEHGQFIMGPEIAELESGLAEFSGAKYALTCSSGTDALLLALMAYDVRPGDAVFVSDFTFIASAEVIALLGAFPVFVDINPVTKNMSPEDLQKKIGKVQSEKKLRARGIICVDLFGLTADYDTISKISEQHGLFLIEDAAQSFGASYKGKKAGSFGNIAATSFFPAKPLGGYGDGGAVFTKETALAEKMKSIRVHGQGNERYHHVRIGLNARLDTLQAAILLPKLEILEWEIQQRNRAAEFYSNKLRDILEVPQVPSGFSSAWAQYSVQHPKREAIRKNLADCKIPTAVYYPIPLHLQPAFENCSAQNGDCPVSAQTAQTIFSLPMHPYLDEAQLDFIVSSVRESVRLAE